MFTGIIEDLGSVIAIEKGSRLRIGAPHFHNVSEGMSVAVNGVCLTAVDPASDAFFADLAPETLARTNLRHLRVGDCVNLERPVTPSTFLSGHIVQGHVDATGELVSLEALGDGNWWLKVRVPAALDRYLVHKGSIAIDGISLTIAALEDAIIGATIIPHTYKSTTLGYAKPGAALNIEVDVLAKHVEKLLSGTGRGPASGS